MKSLELFFSSQDSIEGEGSVHLSSQDSFLSEPDQDTVSAADTFSLNKIRSDPLKQKSYIAHNIAAQRRLRNHKLEVGPGSLPPVVKHRKEVKAEPLSSLNCLDIWTCLETEEDIRELAREYDEGWLEACRLLVKFVTPETFPQAAAQHKFLTEAVLGHRESLVREEAYCSLLHCLASHPPGQWSINYQ